MYWKMLFRNSLQNYYRHHTRRWLTLVAARCNDVPLVLKNSATGNVEAFRAAHPPNITWYCCGPTVYDSAHLGHAYSYVQFDIIRRIIQNYARYNVVFMMNITDLDDKIIKRAQTTGTDWKSLARNYEKEFFQDLRSLNVLAPSITARITDFIPETVSFVTALLEKRLAYVVDDGSVYFDSKAYGKTGLFHKTMDITDTVMEREEVSQQKRAPADFALWKGAKPNEPSWVVPFSQHPGRPGWHIECSTVASLYFGSQVDLHSGGIDLTFPHHENEETQCCAFHGIDQWVRYWIHSGHLVAEDDSKMSKSLKNFVTIQKYLETGSAEEFRMFCMLRHYRSNCQFAEETTKRAMSVLEYFTTFLNTTDAYFSGLLKPTAINDNALYEKLSEAQEKSTSHLVTNFDVPESISVLTELVTHVNSLLTPTKRETITTATSFSPAVASVANFVNSFFLNLGLTLPAKANVRNANTARSAGGTDSTMEMSNILDDVLQFRRSVREEARKGKKGEISAGNLLKGCDNLRDNLLGSGIRVKDHGDSSSWEYLQKKNNNVKE